MEFGIGPDRALSDSMMNSRDFMFPMDSGMLPLRRLLLSSNVVRLDRFPIDFGMGPELVF